MCEPLVRAVVRVRPLLPHEAGEPVVVPTSTGVLVQRRTHSAPRRFEVDQTFFDSLQKPAGRQHHVFRDVGSGLLEEAMRGMSGCVLAYGEAGAGKSHSILGYGEDPGLVPRTISKLFHLVGTRAEVRVRCSYVEVRDHLRDLLRVAGPGGPETEDRLHVHELPSGVCVPHLTETTVSSIDEVQLLVDYGNKRRALEACRLRPTRAHTVFTLHLDADLRNGPRLQTRLCFVDCADPRYDHLGNLATPSIATLHAVVQRLASGQRGHRSPCRRSALTHLLQEFFCGNSRLVVLASVSPAEASVTQTIKTLDFAMATRRLPASYPGIMETQQVARELQAEITSLSRRLELRPEAVASALQRTCALQDHLKWLQEPQSELLRQSDQLRRELRVALEVLGLSAHLDGPYLLNVHDDHMLSGCLTYPLEGVVTIGACSGNAIVLTGLGVCQWHCEITVDLQGLTLANVDSQNRLLRNGRPVGSSPCRIYNGDRLTIGRSHVLIVAVPESGEAVALSLALALPFVRGASTQNMIALAAFLTTERGNMSAKSSDSLRWAA